MTENQEVIKYVNGNILEHETQGSRKVMIFAVDDSGEFGSGHLFRSLIDRYPGIVDKYESLTDLELGDVHVVYDSPQATVVFLIVLSSEDRSTIEDSVMEKAVKRSSVIVKDIPRAMVYLPRIGYGTDLPFSRVEDLLRKYYLSSSIPCIVFHYRKPVNDRKRNVFRAVNNVSDHSQSPLPAKRKRKELHSFIEYKDEDEESSSSSDESSEGDYEPSDYEEDLDEMSSSGEDDMSCEEEENETKLWFHNKKRIANSPNSRHIKQINKSSSPKNDPDVQPEPKTSYEHIKSGIVSLNDVPEDLREQYSDFVMENGGEVVYDEGDLKKATLSIIHTPDLLDNQEKLEKFKEKFEPSCIHVSFRYVNSLKDDQSVSCISSYIL